MLCIFNNSKSLLVSGLHARRYLNSRTTNDINSLKIGQRIESAILNPQGKIEGTFWVLCVSEKSFLIFLENTVDEESFEDFKSSLSRYKVSERVDFIPTPMKLIHSYSQTKNEFGSQSYNFSIKRFDQLGFDILFFNEQNYNEFLNQEELVNYQDLGLDYLRVINKLPLYGLDYKPSLMLPELPFFERLVSFKKGCYVGQEVIERVSALGKPPKLLLGFKLDCQNNLQSKEICSIQEGDIKRIGEVSSYYYSEEEKATFGFALIKNATIEKLVLNDKPLEIV
jgi:tRNA-modifying protein YgfZ